MSDWVDMALESLAEGLGIAVMGGAILLVLFLAIGVSDDKSRDACRAANPGYECTRGWVRGEAFK